MTAAVSRLKRVMRQRSERGTALPATPTIAAAVFALAACGTAEPSPEAAATETTELSSTATGDLAGTYRIDLADGTAILQTIESDGTYVETTPEGARTGGGTWRIGERGAMCFDPEGEQAEECYAGGEPSADGTFELRTADGTLAASVRLVGADAPAPATDASEAAAAAAQ